jgi:hypothetical protein
MCNFVPFFFRFTNVSAGTPAQQVSDLQDPARFGAARSTA